MQQISGRKSVARQDLWPIDRQSYQNLVAQNVAEKQQTKLVRGCRRKKESV
jgi:hypothetical protein